MEKSELKAVYEISFAVPSMADQVNVKSQMSGKHLLLLVQVLQAGLSKEIARLESLLGIMSKDEIEELQKVSTEFLQKAGLTELNERLSRFGSK